MKITFNVDRAKAFSAGYSTTENPYVLEVDPAQLSHEDRQLLASRMNIHGQICRRDKEGYFYDGSLWVKSVPNINSGTRGSLTTTSFVTADTPTLEALLAAIRAEETAIVEHRLAQDRAEAEKKRQIREETLRVLHQRQTVQYDAIMVAKRNDDGTVAFTDTRYGASGIAGNAYYRKLAPDWPSRRDQAVIDSEEAQAWIAELGAENERRQEAAKVQAEQKLLEAEAQAAREAAEREQRKAEKLAWIAEHGDDRLKKAVQLGYDCQRLYVTRRAAFELPGFEVDFDERANWKSRSCPSEAALSTVEFVQNKGFEATVVWLTDPPHVYGDDEEFEPCEAIVIENYLGKYTLVQIV